ncbi:MAG TPA: PHP domain-containing protein [Acidimicrobiales bacterium]|nr:PHP domain-containing protein [Acidimicrobiales bacterium]
MLARITTFAVVDPVVALRRVAYLLEAEGAATYKVRAFRRAAQTLSAEGPARIEELARSKRLTALPGIGDSTAAVITEALAGDEPAYLTDLVQRAQAPASGSIGALRARLHGDCHSHSDWSDGGSPIRDMAEAARDLGHDYLALTDHSPRLTVAHGLNPERLCQQLDVVAELNEELAPFRILTGIEVDILEDGRLDQDESLLARLDVVVASVHSKLSMDPGPMTKRMVAAIESPHTDILGHCTGRKVVGRGRPPSRFDAELVFATCARTGTAVEINSRPERRDPPEPLLRQALALGCLVSIDTDAHAPGQLEWLSYGCAQAVEADTPDDRIVNAWPMEQLLAWTASHAA